MKINKDKIKKFAKKNGPYIAVGTLCALASYAGYKVGYKAGGNSCVYAIHAGVMADEQKFMQLAKNGISNYSGKQLDRLMKDSIEAKKCLDTLV